MILLRLQSSSVKVSGASRSFPLLTLASAAAVLLSGCGTSALFMGAGPAREVSSSAVASAAVTPDTSGAATVGAGSSEYYVQTEQAGEMIDTVQGYMAFMVPTPSTNIQVVFGNAYESSETPGPHMTIRAAIENPIDSTPVQLTFGQNAIGDLPAGGTLTSDAYTGSTTTQNQLVYIRYRATRATGDSTIFPANWIFKAFAGNAVLAPYTTTKANGRFDGVEELRTLPSLSGTTSGTTVKCSCTSFVPQDVGQAITFKPGGKFIIATYIDSSHVTLTATPPQSPNTDILFGLAPEDKTLSGTIYNNDYAYAYAPYALLAVPTGTAKAAALIGDSITYGLGDDATKGGWATRALDIAGSRAGLGTRVHTTIPYVQASMPGDTICNLIVYNKLRFSQLSKTKNVLGLMGTNDIPGGDASKVEGCFITLMQKERAAGPLPWYGTVIPRTTSTDRWATTANQTPTSTESTRRDFNTWLRDGAPIDSKTLLPVKVGATGAIRATFYNSTGGVVHAGSGGTHPAEGIFELADTVETSENSGIWSVPNNHTVTNADLTQGSAVVKSGGTFQPSDAGKTVWLSDQITALGTVKTYDSPTQITLSASAPITRTNAELTFSSSTTARANTADGTHPSDLGAPIMAEAGAAIIAHWTY